MPSLRMVLFVSSLVHLIVGGSLPLQVFGQTLTAIQSGKMKYVILQGKALKYGSASIEGIDLSDEFNPDDY